MSAYIKLATLEYPRHQGDIRLEHPEIGTEFVCPETYKIVEQITFPDYDSSTQLVYETEPVCIDGSWKAVFVVRDLTEQELYLRDNPISLVDNAPDTQDLTASGSAPDVIA